MLHEGLADIEKYDKKEAKTLVSEHHLSHAASAFYSSPFEEAAILTIDGLVNGLLLQFVMARGIK